METTDITNLDEPPNILPRGSKAMLPHGGLPEVISPYLQKLINTTGGINGPIGMQFVAQPTKEKLWFQKAALDPLNEDEHEVAPGLVYKYRGKFDRNGQVIYYGRVLWTIIRTCGSYCRFCTRGREVGRSSNYSVKSKAVLACKSRLDDSDIEKTIKYIRSHPEINEVILSGGDPLTSPQLYLTKIIKGLVKLQKKGQLHIIRLGTRLPVANPLIIQKWHYQILAKINNPYLMVHINHPSELSLETLKVLNQFRKESGAMVFSQTVLLKGVNDNVQTLHDLFIKMVKEGIRPYYVYQNDPVYWAKHFTVPIKKAIILWSKLRPRLSGLAATARFVIDVPGGYGKIPIPEGNAWEYDDSHFFDFKGDKKKLG